MTWNCPDFSMTRIASSIWVSKFSGRGFDRHRDTTEAAGCSRDLRATSRNIAHAIQAISGAYASLSQSNWEGRPLWVLELDGSSTIHKWELTKKPVQEESRLVSPSSHLYPRVHAERRISHRNCRNGAASAWKIDTIQQLRYVSSRRRCT